MDPITLDLMPHITKFLEDPSGCAFFLVPEAYAGTKFEALKAVGFAPRLVRAAAGSHLFEAVAVSLKGERSARLDEALTLIFGSPDRDRLETMLCAAGRSKNAGSAGMGFHPLIVPKAVKVESHDKRELFDTEKDVKMRRLALAEYDRLLRTLARLSGLEVHFHAEGSGIRPPHSDEAGIVHILTNAQPPGHTTARYVSLAFGMKVEESALAVIANGPTKGRGIVLKDPLGEALVQIVGNTWYLLIPTLSHFNWQTSVLIFDKLLSLAWNGWRERGKAEKAKPATRKEFTETVEKWTGDLPTLIVADVANIDRKIEDAQRDLADLTRRKKESLALLEAFGKSSFAKETKGRMPKDFEAIMKDPNVARLSFVDDGFHVETAPLAIEHEGKRYAMGAFTIRIAKRGTVSVWSEKPTHQEGIPHPHIAREGGPCFGNATRAIAEAAGEQRYATAVNYVLRWLLEGYTPALAAVKIGEWPYVGESPDHYETRWLADKALAGADAAGIRLRPIAALAAAVEKAVVDLAKGGIDAGSGFEALELAEEEVSDAADA